MTKPLDVLKALGFGGIKADERIGWLGVFPTPTKDHFCCEFCSAEHLDCTLIEHATDCPVTLARIAVVGN